jgi:hypothetical protein
MNCGIFGEMAWLSYHGAKMQTGDEVDRLSGRSNRDSLAGNRYQIHITLTSLATVKHFWITVLTSGRQHQANMLDLSHTIFVISAVWPCCHQRIQRSYNFGMCSIQPEFPSAIS